ncbi:YCF48-related protein [Maribacter sp. LLG6340-A2]|uniref:YCF48-related protein n=1 Tax=Maribacter sp. LLG6340-A2 TaxID=3160834 RepID=UPI003866ABD9
MNKILPILLLVLLYNTQSFSQWVQTGGPEGGRIKEIVEIENKLILSTNNNIYSSINNGTTWNVIVNDLPTPNLITELTEHNGTLYCSINNKGVYKSLDGGSTWTAANAGIENETFYTLQVFENKIVAGLANGGIMVSLDNGTTWLDRSEGVQNIQFAGLSITETKIYAVGRASAVPQGSPGLYVSENDGETWTPIAVPYINPNGLTDVFVDGTDVYVADVGHIYLSSDEGQTWQQTTLSTFATVRNIGKYEDYIYATTSNGRYYITRDKGSIWTMVKNEESSDFINDLYITNGNILMSTDEGVYQSKDDGITWSSNNTGIKSIWIRAMAANNEYLFAGSAGQGVFRTNNGGENWKNVTLGMEPGNGFINDLLTVNEAIYINNGYGIFKSIDNGDSWESKYTTSGFANLGSLNYKDGLFILTEGTNTILISNDMAETWVSTEINEFSNSGLSAVTLHNDVIFVGTNDGQLFSSNDFGATWKNVSIPIGHHYVRKIIVQNDIVYTATSHGLFISSDLGEQWSRYVAFDTESIHDVIVENDTVYVGTNNGVLVSDSETESWHSFNDGLTNLTVTSLLMHDNQFFIGTEFSSVFKIDKADVSLSLLDYDNDGVINKNDLCPETEEGMVVNEYGCDLVPLKSIKVLATSPTCPTVDNGSIEIISSMLGYDYTIKIIGGNLNQELQITNWQGNHLVDGLPSGIYQVFISIPSIKHEEEFGVTVGQISTISGKHQPINTAQKTVTYTVSGSNAYKVNLNGVEKEFYFNSTATQNIVLSNLKAVNKISISGDSECQGIIHDTIVMEDQIVVYPSISSGTYMISGNLDEATVNVFNSNGQIVLSKSKIADDSLSLNLDDFAPGMYFIKVSSKEQTNTVKVIKR